VFKCQGKAALKRIGMAPIQEPWVREGRLKSLNITGYILFCVGGIDRPTGRILERNMLMLPGCSSRYLVAASIKYYEGEAKTSLVACSAYLPCDSGDPAPTRCIRRERMPRIARSKYWGRTIKPRGAPVSTSCH
jgi:hypothetical protein